MALLFGTSGIPASTKKPRTEEGVRRVAELRLAAMEIEFVRGVNLDEGQARRIGGTAADAGVTLSVHAPYYINLNAKDPEKIESSKRRIVDSAHRGAALGARNIVFHPGHYLDDTPPATYRKIRAGVRDVIEELGESGVRNVVLRPETTGRPSAFGSLDEILRLSSEVPGVLPCVDFSHLHARYGDAANDYDAFSRVLERIGKTLGKAALGDMHMHLSGIEYTDKGERRHVGIDESDMKWKDVLRALHAFDAAGLLICESPEPEVDAVKMMKAWRTISARKRRKPS